MNAYSRFSRLLSPILIATTAMLAAGCGDDSGVGTRYTVTGKVTYKGEPVKKATINFVPNAPDGRGASSPVVDGYYSLTTFSPNDGALPGTYKVTVDDREVDMAKLQADSDALAKKRGVEKFGSIPQELMGQASKAAKGSLPGKYQIPSTSDIEKVVKAESNKIDIELKD